MHCLFSYLFHVIHIPAHPTYFHPFQNWYSYQFTCLQVLEFLKSRQRCVDLLLQHLETSAIMDLILKLVTQVEGSDMRQNILNVRCFFVKIILIIIHQNV